MKRIILIFICLASLATARAQMLGIKTNVLKDVAMTPNISLEVATGSKTSLSAELFGSTKSWGHRFRTIGAAPEWRWWFGGRTFDRFYLGAGVQAVHYDFEWKDELRKGDAGGLGVTFGYDFYLGRHFAIELGAGLGAMAYWQDHEYRSTPTATPCTNREHGVSIVPFQASVSLVYIIK